MSLDFVDIPDTVNSSHGFQLADYKEVIAATASITTILQFLSGALVCQKFIQKGITNEVSSLQFVAGILSCGLWLSYGVLIDDVNIILVNAVGTILFTCYVFLFFTHSKRKSPLVKQVSASITFLVLVRIYVVWLADTSEAATHLGLVACCTTCLFFSAPLSNLAYVLRVKNSESLPFPMIVMSFFVAFQWLLYGIILDNPIIMYPNLAGTLLCVFQLSLFIIYPPR